MAPGFRAESPASRRPFPLFAAAPEVRRHGGFSHAPHPLVPRGVPRDSTALVSGALLALPGAAAAQSCASSPPDNNCVIYVKPGQAGTDDTGESLGDYTYNFSPPTSYNGDTNDAGLRINLVGGAGGNASGHGDKGGTGGSVSSLTMGAGSGTPIEGSTPEGAINLGAWGGSGGGAMYGLDSMPVAASGGNGGTVTATLNGATTAFYTSVAISAQSVGGLDGAGHDGGVGEYAANGGSGGDGRDVTLSQGGSVSNATASGIYLLSQGGEGQNGGNDNAGILQQLGGDGGVTGGVGYTLNGGQTLTAGGVYGVMMQSQGGDAGDGGYALDSHDKITGKDGGNGGTAGTVTATIDGALTVTGTADTGIGVLAQSFGGQGGGGGTTDAKIGGSGDGSAKAKGDGTSATTFGADAAGIMVQSIGGSGGDGGKAGSTLGGKKSSGTGGNGSSQTGLASGLDLGLGELACCRFRGRQVKAARRRPRTGAG